MFSIHVSTCTYLVCIYPHVQYCLYSSFCTDIFKPDPEYLENEEKYKAIKEDILGSSDESEEEDDSDDDDGEDDDEGPARTSIRR